MNTNSFVLWVILQNNAGLDCFNQDSDFAGDLEDSKSTSEGKPCLFGSHTFVPSLFDRINWTPESKSNTSTPKTNWQTYWPREISHVMNGIIFCVCLTLAISVLSIVLKWCQKERQKMQVNIGLAMQRKDSCRATFHCIRNPGKIGHESPFFLTSPTEQHHRTLFMDVFIFGWWWTSHQSLAHKRSTYSQILYCDMERWSRTHNQILFGKTSWCGSRVHQNTALWTELMVSQWNSSGISSQDSPQSSSTTKSKSYCQDWV